MKPSPNLSITLACILLPLTAAYPASVQAGPSAGQYWGAEINGVKAGVFFDLAPTSTNQVQVFFVPALSNSRTNNFNIAPDRLLVCFPPFENRYRMELTDQAGKPVRKTDRGNALGKVYVYAAPTGVRAGGSFLKGVNLTPNTPELIWETVAKGYDIRSHGLCLQDYFKIKDSGKYHFTLQMNVIFWRPEPDDLLLQHIVSLPPVEADLDLQLPPGRWSATLNTHLPEIAGLALCVVGAAWLLLHRRSRRMAKALAT
jgi:hypothetical protein